MTVLVGVCCSNGVVVGADSMSTSVIGHSGLLQLPTDKIRIIGDKVIVAGTGSVGLAQRFADLMSQSWAQKKFSGRTIDGIKALTTLAVNDFRSTGVPFTTQLGYGFGAMVAIPLEDKPQLVEFSVTDMQPEFRAGKLSTLSMGSGQMLADPFLAFAGRVLWGEKVPDVALAKFGVYWTLAHTIKYAPGGVGGPIKIAILQKDKQNWLARLLEDAELEETAMHIQQIEQKISEYPQSIIANAVESQVPKLSSD